VSAARVVLDSTVLISRFLNPVPGGAAFDLLERLRTGNFEIVVSKPILAEIGDVLLRRRIRMRYKFQENDIAEYCVQVSRIATVLDPPRKVRVSRDPNDDMILDCAVAASAEYVVTRDDDLLSLGSYSGIEIVSPEQLLRILRTREMQ
jgi:uncharacterized protein